MSSTLINFLLYQTGWLFCVCGAAFGWPMSGCSAALALVAVHLGLSSDRRSELSMMVSAGLVGVLVETLLIRLDVYRFSGDFVIPWLPPPWILVLWIQFATLLPYSLRWLSGRYWLSAMLGGLGGPLAFLGGARVGAVTFSQPITIPLLLLGLFWSLALPMLVFVADCLFGRFRPALTYRWPGNPTDREPAA